MTVGPRAGLLDPIAEQVHTTLFRALAVLRFVVAAYAVALNASRWHEFDRPVLGWAVVGAIVVWTMLMTWAYDSPPRRRLPLLVADLAVAVAALLCTPLVHSDAMLDRHAATLPSFWVMAAVLAWSIARGWRSGMAAAALMSAVDLSVRHGTSSATWGNVFLLLLAAGVVGYSTGLIRESIEARAEAERIAATLGERARLARGVHDGVLQVLALVQRRGGELGGPAAELGRLAAEQEVALRALIQGNAVPAPAAAQGSDLVPALSALASRRVTVSVPAGRVVVPDGVADELVAAVRACLDNVARHVGEDAPAWVLVESLDGSVVITVRDEGPGIPAGRLEAAYADGRLGVRESIRGRVEDLGGTATLHAAPGRGTEWELTVPVSATRGP